MSAIPKIVEHRENWGAIIWLVQDGETGRCLERCDTIAQAEAVVCRMLQDVEVVSSHFHAYDCGESDCPNAVPPFTLANQPAFPRGDRTFGAVKQRQRVLLSGLDCLPDQGDLWDDIDKPE